MPMKNLPDLQSLKALVQGKNHSHPTLVLIRSNGCPPCQAIYPKINELADTEDFKSFEFYEFNVDPYLDDPQLDADMTRFAQDLGLQFLPSQILLAPEKEPKIIATSQLDVIEDELGSLRGDQQVSNQKS
ncbi:TlpA family protein disulfide reductase [Pseudomonas muyukensis]|uniref:Thioredoxin family protein n=1 Tax=Pseudomonas muyukensis TaxID=2842357 RepID=A0ABX8MCN3_9PSED|nr:thioredoxin family protein [Pseudomonas muyukensis]QXH36831.1 thioredoxin family protein [Pseudomonas muyukensis]